MGEKGHPSSRKGKHLTEEVKAKMSAAHKGKPSGYKGQSAWNKGKHYKVVDGKQVYY